VERERRRLMIRIALLVALLAGGAIAVRFTPAGDWLEGLARDLAARARAPWAAPAYVVLYAAAIALGAPGTLMTLIGAAAFGVGRGLVVNLAGATIGATLAFLEGRTIARHAVERLFGHHLAKLPDLSSPRAAFFAFLRLRLIPLVPFNALSFAAGLTRARLLPYVAGTFVGILPSTAAYTWFAAELLRGEAGDAAGRIVMILGLACLAAVIPTVIARRGGASIRG
jgi:uncharacterized membrane protein YdjX (TVP38/TMEM64 family)